MTDTNIQRPSDIIDMQLGIDTSIEYVKTSDIVGDACTIIDGAQTFARQAVNVALVRRNWLLGRRIAEEEMNGEDRAEYGAKIIKNLSAELTARYGKGFAKSNLYSFAQFYKLFPDIFQPAIGKFRPTLSWTHYLRLLKVTSNEARAWYENEAIQLGWSARTLTRNVNTSYYERLLMSQVKEPVINEMEEKTAELQINRLEFVKNPVIAEFLGIPQNKSFAESELEEAIITNLQSFLMEMGKGYAFVARQQHIRTELSDYYIDLVFYNYILKCFVLIDLKADEITHQDVGQMDMYVRMYDDFKRGEGDNPTLGIVLCAETDRDVARYSVLHDNNQLFAAKYQLFLPSDEELRAEIEHQKHIFRLQHGEDETE